jgi:serine/threonine protein kinase
MEKRKISLSSNKIKKIFKEILSGMNYIHKNLFMHRDLKPSNILISELGTEVKITDFGFIKRIDIFGEEKMNTEIGKAANHLNLKELLHFEPQN